MAFYLPDNAGDTEGLHIGIERHRIFAASNQALFNETEMNLNGPVPFALVVGRRSAALVVDGQIRAALRLPPSVSVVVQPRGEVVNLFELRVGDPPPESGCDT